MGNSQFFNREEPQTEERQKYCIISLKMKKQNKTKKTELRDSQMQGTDWQLSERREGVGENGQKIQISSYKCWGYNVQHGILAFFFFF